MDESENKRKLTEEAEEPPLVEALLMTARNIIPRTESL